MSGEPTELVNAILTIRHREHNQKLLHDITSLSNYLCIRTSVDLRCSTPSPRSGISTPAKFAKVQSTRELMCAVAIDRRSWGSHSQASQGIVRRKQEAVENHYNK